MFYAQDKADADLRRSLDAIYCAQIRANEGTAGSNMPSLTDSRELVRLFIRIGSDDVRHTLLQLMRTIATPQGPADQD